MIKVAMMSYTLARGVPAGEDFDVVGLCRLAQELNVDGVDWVTTYGQDPAEVARITADHGLKTVCYTFFCDLTHSTVEGRAPGREQFRRELQTAVALGVDKIMLPCAGKEDLRREESFSYTMAGLAEVLPLAQEVGITVTVEHFPAAIAPFINSRDMARAVGELPDLRVTFDSGNPVTAGESAEAAYRANAPWVVHAHFKDWKRAAEGMCGLDGNCRVGELVGDGEVDNVAATKAMRELGYDGYVDFEYEGTDMSPETACRRGIPRMQEWFAGRF
ncbi:MAG TPA: sugar phosphate isomerase/epimerase family protein [Armatimonadota bacterium]